MPDPKPVIIDGNTPTDSSRLTKDEALAAMRLMVTKLPPGDLFSRLDSVCFAAVEPGGGWNVPTTCATSLLG